jgi:membrane fusion protein, copper/silver efflux system
MLRTATVVTVVLAASAAAGAAAYLGYRYGLHRAPQSTTAASMASTAPGPQGSEQRKVLYWYDPMVPQQKFDKPGKSPFMDMQLVPRYADEADSGGSVRISSAVAQNLGLRTALVEEGVLSRRVNTVGTVQADEHRIVVMQSRAHGYVERLYVRAVNDAVRRGQLVAEVYAPDLLAAQEEYVFLRERLQQDPELARAARDRLSLLGVPEATIEQLDRGKPLQRRVGLYAPISGVVTELAVREGAAVSPGMPMATLLDLSAVWIVADVPEAQIDWVRTGRRVDASVSALSGERFQGKVDYIYPEVDTATRTVKVRCAVPNPGFKLKPGMVAQVTILGGEDKTALMVPTDAVIHSGTRSVVIVTEDEGHFRPVEVKTGFESGDSTEVLSGLTKGERVVVSGQFLIDSEANLKGVMARLGNREDARAGAQPIEDHAGHAMPADPQSAAHQAEGSVTEVDADAGQVVISHGAVASLDWPPMTMGFEVADKAMLSSLKPGQKIRFEFAQTANGDWVIRKITPSR